MITKIMDFINEEQHGKSGIYPYHVALEVCARFNITLEEAQQYVSDHIKRVMDEDAMSGKDITDELAQPPADYAEARKVIATYASAYPGDKYAANWLKAHPE